jgi:uncharacterized MAPEG superfamily protein
MVNMGRFGDLAARGNQKGAYAGSPAVDPTLLRWQDESMTTELKMLGWSIFLGLAYIFIAAGLATAQRGLKWNASNRDGEFKPLTGVAARAARANGNFLETFGFFAAAVLAVVLAKQNTEHTALGAQLYFWARAAYLPIYLVGVPYLRTVVWAVSLWGMLQVLEGLF